MEVIEEQNESQEILDFMSNSIDIDHQSVKQRVQFALQQGADPLFPSRQSGQTMLHLIAANWDREIAALLMGKIPNIDVRDSHGRTPLHEAAASNNYIMVEWLIEQQANLEAKTVKENQTPLHYAARFDAIQSIKVLLQAGAFLESRDYRCRTPLHLAVDMGRALAAEFLISMPTPAEVRVAEKDGNMAMSGMIKTMPHVAYKALDQLRQIDPGERTESFILSYLEPDLDKLREEVKSPFDTAVSQGRSRILAHPVMQALIKEKWKFIRIYFYMYLSLYILFIIIWSVLMCVPTLHEQHIYRFPQDIWRVLLQVTLVILYVFLLLEEAVVIVISLWKHVQFVKSHRLKYNEDIGTLILTDKEREFLMYCPGKPSRIPPYFKDIFTIITIASNVLAFLVIVMYIANVHHYSRTFADWTARITCFATILLWFRVIKFLRAIQGLGSLISVIFEIKGDIFRYFLLAAIIYTPYVLSFWLLFGGPQSASLPDGPTKKDLSTFYHIAVMAFRITLIDSYPYDEIRELDEGMTLILIAPYILFLAIIGLNLFIALMSNTFQRVQDEALANSLLQWANLISFYEEKRFCKYFQRSYYKHIQSNCNPLVNKLMLIEDDDWSERAIPIIDSLIQEMDTKSGINGETVKTGNTDIDTLKEELISSFKDLLKGTQGKEEEEILSSVPGGLVRTYTRNSTCRQRAPTLREKEWQKKIQSIKRKI